MKVLPLVLMASLGGIDELMADMEAAGIYPLEYGARPQPTQTEIDLAFEAMHAQDGINKSTGR